MNAPNKRSGCKMLLQYYKSKTIYWTCDVLSPSFGLSFSVKNLRGSWLIPTLQSKQMIEEVVGFKFGSLSLAIS